jgi:hypothetical protein
MTGLRIGSHHGLDHARHREPRGPALDVDLELDRLEARLMVDGAHRAVDLQHDRARLRLLALEDRRQRLALRRVGAHVDHRQHAAVALVNGAGPRPDVDRAEAVQARRAEMALLDLPGGDRDARAVGGQRVELAGAAVGAVAVDDMRALDAPMDLGHDPLPPA